jgi:hypothetical protein
MPLCARSSFQFRVEIHAAVRHRPFSRPRSGETHGCLHRSAYLESARQLVGRGVRPVMITRHMYSRPRHPRRPPRVLLRRRQSRQLNSLRNNLRPPLPLDRNDDQQQYDRFGSARCSTTKPCAPKKQRLPSPHRPRTRSHLPSASSNSASVKDSTTQTRSSSCCQPCNRMPHGPSCPRHGPTRYFLSS